VIKTSIISATIACPKFEWGTDEAILEMPEEEFDSNEDFFSGFELVFEQTDQSFLAGYNRFDRWQKDALTILAAFGIHTRDIGRSFCVGHFFFYT